MLHLAELSNFAFYWKAGTQIWINPLAVTSVKTYRVKRFRPGSVITVSAVDNGSYFTVNPVFSIEISSENPKRTKLSFKLHFNNPSLLFQASRISNSLIWILMILLFHECLVHFGANFELFHEATNAAWPLRSSLDDSTGSWNLNNCCHYKYIRDIKKYCSTKIVWNSRFRIRRKIRADK